MSSSRALILKNKSLEAIENSPIVTILTSDNLFLKLCFILSLKQGNLTPGFLPRAGWIAVPPIFTADMFVGPKMRAGGSSGSLE